MTVSEQKKFYEGLGLRIKTARNNANIKQQGFADQLNLSRASIVNIEKGRQHPQLHTLCEIAKVLKIKVEDLLPNLSSPGVVNPELKKLISKELKRDKTSKDKLIGFIEQIHISNITEDE
jgi:DNA-binding XRE family transcriptional regulator